jgi:hypothetical protein
VAAVLAVTLVAGAGAAGAATIFSDGFESGDYSAWTTVLTGADGSATVQGAVVKTGTKAARLSATTTTGSFAYAKKSLPSAQTDVSATGDFQVQAEGAAGGNVPIFRMFDANAAKVVSLYRQNGGAGVIWVWYDNTYNVTSASLPLNTWAQLQVHVVMTGSATGTVDVSVNGTTAYHSSTATVSAGGVGAVQIGNNSGAQAFTIIADNISVADGAAAATPPTNTVRPSISGTAQQGQTLTANPGTWSGTQPITYKYQWRQCTSTGTSCVDISGAIATTYVPGPTDVGHAITVFVTANNTGGNASLDSLPTAAVQAPSSGPPVNTSPPTITGTAQQGQTLTANPGSWTGTQPINYAYQWRQCTSTGTSCVDLTGAKGTTYVPGPTDVGHAMRVFVTASNTAGNASLRSQPTAAVQGPPAAPTNTSLPTITGTAQQGQTLTANPGTWTGTTPITYTYLWQRCDSAGANCASAGVTTPTYVLTAADLGRRMRVVVTGANGVSPNGTATSNPTAVVASTGLAALWHMDETSGSLMHDAVGNHTGTLNSVKLGQSGYLGTAFGFTGSSYASVPSASDLNPGSANITITIHLKATSTPASPDWDLIRKGLYTTSGGEYKMEYQPSGQASCGFNGSVGYSELIAGPAINDGRWHTVQCVKTSTAIKLIVDGTKFSQSANVGTIANTDPVVIGARPGSDFFQGSLDEASIQIG